MTLLDAVDLLDDLGIRSGIDHGYLLVNRTSMVNFFPSTKGEQNSYDEVLEFLQGEFPKHRVTWGGRTDDHLLAIFYERPL